MIESRPSPISSAPATSAVLPSRDLDSMPSCREPLLILFLSAAAWLVVGSLLALIASIKLHQPALLAQWPELTFGRVQPAAINCILYGFCLQAGLGTVLYLFVRLGECSTVSPILVALGAMLWNFGVFVGILGIFNGETTGFQSLQMPRYAQLILFISYLVIGTITALTFHVRRRKALFVSQWFALAALFWFGWIHSTAILMLMRAPVRGVAQAVIAWWFAANFQTVWMGLIGLAAVFYFIPRLVNRQVESRYLALFTFWILTLFGAWTGIPNCAPVPAWIPALSTVASVVTILAAIAVLLNVHRTIAGAWRNNFAETPLNFFIFAVLAFVLTIVLGAVRSLPPVAEVLDLTWFGMGLSQLGTLGFFAMAMFGAIYFIVFDVLQIAPADRGIPGLHFWLAAVGVILLVIPLLGAGVVEGLKLQDAHNTFMDAWNAAKPFIRASTTGLLLFLGAAIVFFLKIARLASQFYRKRTEAAYALATMRTAE